MTTSNRTLRTFTLASSVALSLMSGGCFLLGEGTEFLQADDVRLELPETVSDRDLDPTKVHGDVHDAVLRVTADVNGWVTTLVESSARVVELLDRVPESSRDGAARIYGPYEDRDGRDLSWLVRLDETDAGTEFELHVGTRAAKSSEQMARLMTGSLVVGEGTRSGGFSLDFDVVEKYRDMLGSRAELYSYGGAVDVTFERETDSQYKHIDMDFQDFSVDYAGYLDDSSFFSDDLYSYHREQDGAGSFHLALLGEWDQWGWSGPEQEKMTLDAKWDPAGAGRTRGTILEQKDMGDMKHGDLQVDECFGADGYLTWRQISAAYLVEVPDYDLGDPESCAALALD